MEHVTPETPMSQHEVTVRYWAGAAAAAGCEREVLALAADRSQLDGSAVRAAIAAAHPGIEPVLRRCALLVDGVRLADDDAVAPDRDVEVLPPFVGG